MNYNECLQEGMVLAHAVQEQLLVSAVFIGGDPAEGLGYVRQLSTLKHRMTGLMLRGAAKTRTRRRTARTRL